MMLRHCYRFILASLLLGLLASASLAGTVAGTVRNGTTGKPAVGVEVILIQLQGTMQPVANTKTDSQGRYQFDHPMLGTAPMLLRAVYRGVNYHEPVPPGTTAVDLQVFEPTDKPSAFRVTAHAIILQPTGSDLVVAEEYNIQNATKPPVAYYRADGSFSFSLPTGAQLGDVSAVAASGMPVNQTPIDKGSNGQAIAYAFRPGDSEVRLSYRLPYPGNQTRLAVVSHYAAERVAIFAQPSVQVQGDGFSPAGQEQGFNVYLHGQVAANAPVSILVSGTAPAPPQSSGASNPAAGDDSQNPSVNSRAESGAEASTASVTSMPARLDSLKWIIVAGFGVLFAFGLFYLWRQPQTAAEPASADAPSGKRKDSAAPKAADLDREIRGSLDGLKDALFRLELRREAGTIGQDEYARERERMQKVLRDLVKG